MNGGAPVVLCVENDDKGMPYIAALKAAGVPAEEIVQITPESHPDADFTAMGATARGLLLCGGPDIHPERYGQTPREEAGLSLMPELDPIEFALLAGAEDAATPVLGICRGMQVANVHLGGTLYQDIQQELPGIEEHYYRIRPDYLAHEIEVLAADRPIGELFSRTRPHTNSRHHQAVREMGRGLVPIAYSPDGVLEVMQLEDNGWWLWAVQWHPENLVEDEQQIELFKRFVSHAESEPASPRD